MTDVLQAANDIERAVVAETRTSQELAPRMPTNVRMPLFHPYYRPPPAVVYPPPPALIYPNYVMPPFNHAAAMSPQYANAGNYIPLAPITYSFLPPQGPPVFPPNPFV